MVCLILLCFSLWHLSNIINTVILFRLCIQLFFIESSKLSKQKPNIFNIYFKTASYQFTIYRVHNYDSVWYAAPFRGSLKIWDWCRFSIVPVFKKKSGLFFLIEDVNLNFKCSCVFCLTLFLEIRRNFSLIYGQHRYVIGAPFARHPGFAPPDGKALVVYIVYHPSKRLTVQNLKTIQDGCSLCDDIWSPCSC